MVFGEIKVHDQDHSMHPNGMHHIDILMAGQNPSNVRARVDNRFEVKYDAEGLPWLALKQGMSLDEETLGGSVDVIIRAVDMDGATNARGTDFTGSVAHQTVTILINDQNDAPVAQTIGNWWVTVQDDLRSDEISKGEWLDFSLEREGIAGDDKPAFKDPDGDTLTYSLSGPSILEINPRTGQITNKEGAVPVRGMHKLTVTATDPDGASVSQSFYLSIGFSEPGENYTEDNEEPVIRVTSELDYRENSGMRRVATFTVTDDDNDLGHHPFAVDSVRITSVVDGNTDSTDNDSTDDPSTTSVNEAQGMTGYGGAFRLSDPVKNGDTWTYHVYVRDTNPNPRVDTTSVLNYENVDRLTITITASDGVADAVTEEIEIRIDDVNEAPVIDNPTSNTPAVASGDYGVNQSETQKEVVYIKLEDLWMDPEGDDDPDDLTYTLTKTGSWITILHQPGEWGDIKEGRDGDDGTDDDVAWNSTTNQAAVVIGDDATEPGDREQVAIIQIDRTGSNNGQGESGSYTITARDSDGATGSKTYTIRPTDRNLPPSGAVEISGSAREDATLRVTFNDDKDPDLRGNAEPALVLYEWYQVEVADDGTETEGASPFHVGTSNTYQLKQGDVGDKIRVKVKYYEVFQGQLMGLDTSADLDTTTDGTQINGDTTDRTVSNTPDKGAGHITILADANALMVTDRDVRVTDGDYTTVGSVVAHDGLTWSWQWSSNGRGGWQDINQTGDSDTSSLELDGDPNTAGNDGNGQSRWYRAVATYDADGIDEDTDASDGDDDEMESVYSDPIQVANINNGPSGTPAQATPAPTISGNPFPGGTLTVNAGSATVDVQWQMSRGTGDWTDIAGATGSLTLTQAHVGANIRAVVSYKSTAPNAPGVTAVVAVEADGDADGSPGGAIRGGTTQTAAPVRVDAHDIEVSVMGTGHHPLFGTPAYAAAVTEGTANNAGWNLSHTEEINLASLFQDPDSSRLTFTVTAGAASGLGAGSASGNTYLFDAASGGVLVFEVQGSTGKLTFNSDVYRGHDGTGTDGTGNIITLSINANDGANDSEPDATVNLRINVAPTDIWFAAAEDSPSDAAEATTVVTVDEHVGARAGGAGPNGELVAHVNVQDENADSHKFGTHDVMVHGDDRFMVTHTGYTAAPTSRDTDRLGSTWEIRLKPGAKLDAETQMDMDPVTEGKQIVLTVTATDMGGLSTPPGAANAIKLTITVGDLDAAAGDRNHPTTPTPADVPGLKDDEATDTDDREDDTTADDDTDGGANPPPPGMSLGGIIEDFVANADAFDQDLLEDFTLMIDDGIEIA
ncbi:MAG: hypothetical protein F4X06_02580 [Gammaproteobacteria bacterium]|nr:hypothetical protein [Gammaproteobacteria bacterium]